MGSAGIHRRQIADRQISPLKRYLSLLNGTYIEEYFNYPTRATAPNGYSDPSGVDAESFLVHLKNGGVLSGTYIGTGTLLAPQFAAGELSISLDETAEDGVEYNPGVEDMANPDFGAMLLTRGAQAPHFFRAKLTIQQVAEISYCALGYREQGAVNPVFDNYTDLGAINVNLGDVKTHTISNNAATVDFDTLVNVVDGEEFELKAVLENFGVRFFFNGKEYGSKFALHSSVTQVFPFLYIFNVAAGAGSGIVCSEMQAGFLSDVDDHRIL